MSVIYQTTPVDDTPMIRAKMGPKDSYITLRHTVLWDRIELNPTEILQLAAVVAGIIQERDLVDHYPALAALWAATMGLVGDVDLIDNQIQIGDQWVALPAEED